MECVRVLAVACDLGDETTASVKGRKSDMQCVCVCVCV